MKIRIYKKADYEKIVTLFYNTVHSINSKDYTKNELDAWAPDMIDMDLWHISLTKNYSIVFIKNDIIVGFGDLSVNGYLDKHYVHKNYQRKRIAKKRF